MTSAQSMIRLGRSKSPTRHKTTLSSHLPIDYSHPPLQSSIHREVSVKDSLDNSKHSQANLSMHGIVRCESVKHVQHVKVSPPAHVLMDSSLHTFGTQSSSRVQVVSPQKRVVVVNNQNGNGNFVGGQIVKGELRKITEGQGQLLRKVKVLEARIEELHKEKQVYLVKTNEENKRLKIQGQNLQKAILEIQNAKNIKISQLQQQLNYLRNIKLTHQNQPIKQNQPQTIYKTPQASQIFDINVASLKNIIYTDGKQNQTPIKNIPTTETTISEWQQQNKSLKIKIKQLEQQNQRVKQELQEMKQAVVRTTAIIQENNKSIIENYEHKINGMLCQMEEYEKNVVQQQAWKQSWENNQEFIRQYSEQLRIKTRQLEEKQRQNQEIKETLKQSRLQIEQYISKLWQKSQELADQEQQFSNRMSQLSNLSQIYQIKAYEAEVKVKTLEEQLQKGSAISERPKSNGNQACKKCRQLIRTIAKLNSKTFPQSS